MSDKKVITIKTKRHLSVEELNKRRALEKIRGIIKNAEKKQVTTGEIPIISRISAVVGGCPICLNPVMLDNSPIISMKLMVCLQKDKKEELRLAQSGISRLVLSGRCGKCHKDIFVELNPFDFEATRGIINSSVDFSADHGILPKDKLL